MLSLVLLYFILEWGFFSASPNNTTLPPLPTIKEKTPCFQEPEIQFFMYHYIRDHDLRDAPATRDLSLAPHDFRTHMAHIRELSNRGDITLMSWGDFLNSIQTGCFPWERIWIFTSDDGWVDSYLYLFPIASEYRVPFFLWIIGDRIDTNGFMTSAQIMEIAQNPLFTLSSHSMTHTSQSKMTETIEHEEICTSKQQLEDLIHLPIWSYIYPIWHMSPQSAKILKECGYQIAWSTQFWENWNPKNPTRYNINRIRIHNTTTTDLFDNLRTPLILNQEPGIK
jgi:peptidoglycan/xylan/chitin deacetylase (PgdA/CDA1 family)